jgi:phage protein D
MRPLYGYHDALAPRIMIEADDTFSSDILAYITKFEFESDATKSSQLKLTVANPQFRWTEDPRLQVGIKFRVCWGYPTDMSEVFTTSIMKAKPTFPDGGTMPVIDLVAFDLRHGMTAGSEPKNWGSISSSEVAKRIANEYNFGTDVEESGDDRKKARIQPAGVNDFMFVQQLAAKLNFACYLDNDVLHFHSYRLNETPVLEFTYYNDSRGTIIEFTPEVDMNKPSGVKVVGATSTESKEKEADGKDPIPSGMISLQRFVSDGSRIRAHEAPIKAADGTHHMRLMNISSFEERQAALQRQANAAAQKINMSAVKASMKVVGTPRLKANQMIRISGVGKAYSGNWYVVTAKHVISPTGTTYITELKLSRNALNKKVPAKAEGKEEPTGKDLDALAGDVGTGYILRVDKKNIHSQYVKGSRDTVAKKVGVR